VPLLLIPDIVLVLLDMALAVLMLAARAAMISRLFRVSKGARHRDRCTVVYWDALAASDT
jgi:hypothetical protein